MRKNKSINKKVSRFVYWTPRVLSILFILFLAIFSLDVFGNGYTFWQTVCGLLIHNIPSFLLLIVLLISWEHEWLGAIVFLLAGLLYLSLQLAKLPWSLIIAGPAFLIGILFLVNWKKKRKKKRIN